MTRARAIAACTGLSCVLASANAWADRVLVAPFTRGAVDASEKTNAAQLDDARVATEEAAKKRQHVVATDEQREKARAVVLDGIIDTAAECRAAGKAASVDWTVRGVVDSHGWTYRLELEACQVSTGRVESVAREIDARQAPPLIADMLGYLLRPEGIGASVPPWEAPAPSALARAGTDAPNDVSTMPPRPPEVAPPPAPTTRGYAEDHPWSAGVAVGGLGAFSRPSGARGSSVSGTLGATFGYAFPAVPGAELRLDVTGGLLGPQSIAVDGGLRYVLPVSPPELPRPTWFIGPEMTFGGFFVQGGDKQTRLLLRGAFVIAWAPKEHVQLEAVPEIDIAAGGTGAIGLLGGTLRASYRF